jgi:hypothetical protein
MSTKIYDAYEWKGTLTELMTFLREYRIQYQKGLLEAFVALPYTHKIEEEEERGAEMDFIDRLHRELTEASRSVSRHPLACEASVVVVPYNERLFVKVYGFDGFYRPKFKHEKLVDYHYQNQTDQPKYVTKEDWDERENTWNDILDNSKTGSLGEVGLEYGFFKESDIWDLVFNLKMELRNHKK